MTKIRPATTAEIADFIYRGLNYWSIYKADVPDLANNRFDSESEKKAFLEGFETPEEAFDALTSPRDRFSILRDDYIVLENALAGVRLLRECDSQYWKTQITVVIYLDSLDM